MRQKKSIAISNTSNIFQETKVDEIHDIFTTYECLGNLQQNIQFFSADQFEPEIVGKLPGVKMNHENICTIL